MKKLITIIFCLPFIGCGINSETLKEACTKSIECYISENQDYIDISDIETYKDYQIESCVQSIYAEKESAAILKCDQEYANYINCQTANMVYSCDFSDSNTYYDEMQYINDTVCWTEYAKYYECM